MSLNSILQVGLSGVLASENALQTASNNISNENTPGYVRESANLAENASLPTGYGSLGEGVNVASVTRDFSNYAQTQLMNATSLSSATSGQTQTLNQLSSLFPVSSGQSGLSSAISHFYAAFQTLSSNPSSTPDRQSVLSQAQSLTAQYQNAMGIIGSTQTGLVQQMRQSVSTINGLSAQLAGINKSILATPQGTPVPNSLLDQQARALDQLSKQVGVNTIPGANGTLIVATKSGATLVDGSQSMKLSVQTGGTYQQPGQAGIVYQPTGQSLTGQITGGALGGALAAQNNVNSIQLQYGLLAQGITDVTNTQQAMGVNLKGQLGTPIFSVQGPQVFPAGANQGTATITATVTDLSTVPATTYTLEYNGAQWNVVNNTSGNSQTVSASSGGTLSFGGMSLQITGTPASGDHFLVNPAGSTAGSFQTVMTNPSDVAAAFPYVASPGTYSASAGLVNNNTGSETLSSGGVSSPSGTFSSGVAVVPSGVTPQSFTLTFTSNTQYQVATSGGTVVASGTWGGAGSTAIAIPYPSGSLASGAAMTFAWGGGTPASGDAFTFSSGAPGNNANAVSMAQAANQPVLAQGSINQFTADMTNSYGNMAQAAKQNNASAQTTLTQAQTALSNLSGVNLNAE
ncbi:MAG: flagellar hook-associated protein FlgK, partial [Acidithiobacillus sp.]